PDHSKQYSQCLADIAYEKKGIAGYAMMLFSSTSSRKNYHFNQNAFEKMRNESSFSMAFNSRCN
ncbi:MAG: hypothetical protein HKN16_07635, partial [Saprospiraceae bacterium]|nr:hypothetical protein [Saprospiraceae bacterium]